MKKYHIRGFILRYITKNETEIAPVNKLIREVNEHYAKSKALIQTANELGWSNCGWADAPDVEEID